MNLKIASIIILLGLSVGLSKSIQKKVDAEIENTFDIETFSFKEKVISPSVAKTLPATFETDNFFEIKTENKLLGYAYVNKAPSKTDDFDYLVLLDTDLVIVKTKVLAYREDYGGEIGSKRWLKQFIGKTQNDELKYQQNIVAISGATISVRSMTNAVNNLLKSLKILRSKNIL
ncbi:MULTISPECIES: FMN-binding protein [unclassified Bizionia]|uniref:FMN-binding protein n=1 Tax=unclassified Bizionia TaxID=2626393 RepID=UPI00205A25E7|nr:FMN-binding protein [Bizionia sp. M204]UPS91630.1 FMN-binding protein [Bizionia sp. M204]